MGNNLCSCSNKDNIVNSNIKDVNLDRSSLFSNKRNENASTYENTTSIIEERFKENKVYIQDENSVKYNLRYVLFIQHFFRKYSKGKKSFHQLKNKSRVSINSSNNKNYHLDSLNLSEISEMDSELKNILEHLTKPYKLKSSTMKKEGFCILEWDEGTILQGFFKKDQIHGIVKIKTSDGKSFEGEFYENKVSGYGILKNANETLFEGIWENNKITGVCLETWKDGATYQGEYYNGYRNGIGDYKLPDGTHYEGNFTNDLIEGYGTIYFKNNNKYSGQWKEDKLHGYGEYIWKNGSVYRGFWENDKKSGFGLYYWNNPVKAYMGFWKDNKQHGIGCIINNKLVKYGKWEEGERIKWIDGFQNAIKFIHEKDQMNFLFFFPKDTEEAKNVILNL